MAIKASAQITLHYVVDIQGIYRYYLLQGSTLAKPSKPASYPPDGTIYGPLFTNVADPDSSDWLTNQRYSESLGGLTTASTSEKCIVTNYIPVTKDDVITVDGGTLVYGHAAFDANKNVIAVKQLQNGSAYWTSISGNKVQITNDNVKYIRFTLAGVQDKNNVIITVNEEIEYGNIVLPNSWTDTEPTYQNGATNSLYFVDCTVFSDGTYEYSEVSLSTAYEAAKEAWNKAQNAQDSADSAQGAIEDLENEVTDSLDKVASDLTSLTTTTNTKFEAIDERFRITAEGYETKLQNTGDGLQAQITEIMKHFDFTADGMVIGQKDNPFKTTIDNDRYEMSSNGIAVVWIEGGVFFVPEIIVTSRFKMLGYDIKETPVTINGTTIMRTDWDYIGGE